MLKQIISLIYLERSITTMSLLSSAGMMVNAFNLDRALFLGLKIFDFVNLEIVIISALSLDH